MIGVALLQMLPQAVPDLVTGSGRRPSWPRAVPSASCSVLASALGARPRRRRVRPW